MNKQEEQLLNYFNGDTLAAKVWKSKYASSDEVIPSDMHVRLSKALAEEYNSRINGLLGKQVSFEGLSEYGTHKFTSDLINNDILTQEGKLYQLLDQFKQIIPAGSIMAALGTNPKEGYASLSNCYVVGQPHDSFGGILKKDYDSVQIMKRRGGVGVDLSLLRPAEATVRNSAKTSSGAAGFTERFSNSTREVAQNGRRGACMVSMDIRHPDSMKFILLKQDGTKATGCNMSVGIPDDFIMAALNKEDYILRWPVYEPITSFTMDEPLEYNTMKKTSYTRSTDGKVYDGYVMAIKAKEYWDTVIDCAWKKAEPGIIFLDSHWDYSPETIYPKYKMVTTNPCGEQALPPYGRCMLMAINLLGVVKNPWTKNAQIDFDLLYKLAYEQMVMLDIICDIETKNIERIIEKIKRSEDPQQLKDEEIELWEKIKDQGETSRRVGAGFLGLGDMIAALGEKYDSEKSLNDIIEPVMRMKEQAELDATIDMSKLFGSFIGFDAEKESITTNKFYIRLKSLFPEHFERMMKYGRRNVNWSTVAPTGSLGILTQTTSGIEPVFQLFYTRRTKCSTPNDRVDFVDVDGEKFTETNIIHKPLKDWALANGITKDLENMPESELKEVVKLSPWYNSTANDINWVNRVKVQQCVQKYTTSSISSTINLPSTATIEDVRNIYEESFKSGLKGITVYRDGSRGGILVTSGSNNPTNDFEPQNAPKRPKLLKAEMTTIKHKGEKYAIVVGLMNERPYETFIMKIKDDNKDKFENMVGNKVKGETTKLGSGKYQFKSYDGQVDLASLDDLLGVEERTLGFLISHLLRHRVPIHTIIKTVKKTSPVITSFANKISLILSKYVPNGTLGDSCPECGTKMVFDNGCMHCPNCGWTKCG